MSERLRTTCPVCGARFVALVGIRTLNLGRLRTHDRGILGRSRYSDATKTCPGSGHTLEEASVIAHREIVAKQSEDLR